MIEATMWTCDEAAEQVDSVTPDDAIMYYLDGIEGPLPETVTVYGFCEKPITERERKRWANRTLENLLEAMDDEHGDPEESTEPDEPMKSAAASFVNAVLLTYHNFRCEQVDEETVNVREWCEQNALHWLTEDEHNRPRPVLKNGAGVG